MQKVKRFEHNQQGKDYVVGDLHGCLEDLLLALKAIDFDENVDRLFSVGDLVDRGPNSLECAELIYKPWFHSVKGNHEEMMIQTILYDNPNARSTWFSNGGHWAYDCDKGHLKAIAKDLEQLPLVIVVGEGDTRFNIVHAEILKTGEIVSDDDIDKWNFGDRDEIDMIWGRTLAVDVPHYFDASIADKMQGNLSRTYVGHTPMRKLTKIAKQIYLDRGCVYFHTSVNKSEMNSLAIACPQDGVIYEWNPMWRKLVLSSEQALGG